MAFVDPYIDQATGILKNLLGAVTAEDLAEREAQIVFANQLELESVIIPRTNDLNEVLLIHKQLFKGIYEWAGEIRTVDIKKHEDNAEFFLVVGKIIDAANYVFSELAKENHLKNIDKAEFVKRLAHHYDQLNYIHPFREGNGRVQRVFWTRVAKNARYDIDWDAVIGDENDEASRLAYDAGKRFDGDYIAERRAIEAWMREEAKAKGLSLPDTPLFISGYSLSQLRLQIRIGYSSIFRPILYRRML